MVRRGLTLLLIFLFCLSAMPVQASEELLPNDLRHGSLSLVSNGTEFVTDYYYQDAYFHEPGTELNPHLRTMSMVLAMSSFSAPRETASYAGGSAKFDQLVTELGFSGLYHNRAYDTQPTEDSIGVAIASKSIETEEGPVTVLAVGIRGADYGAEWAGNVRIGAEGQARGFSRARQRVLQCLRRYEAAYCGEEERVKIWMVGFSRAGAVANLAAEAINRYPARYQTTEEDLYCYTFEAPQAEQRDTAISCRNIHNTVNLCDVVPLMAPADWGFVRVGYPQEDQKEPYTRDDTVLPDPDSADYAEHLPGMLEHLRENNPSFVYLVDTFTANEESMPSTSQGRLSLSDLVTIVVGEPQSQSEFLQETLTWLNTTLPENPRQVYAARYQDAFASLMHLFLLSAERQESVDVALQAALRDRSFFLHLFLLVETIQFQNTLSGQYEKALQAESNALADVLLEHLREAGAGLSEEEEETLRDSMAPTAEFFGEALVDDFLHHKGRYFLTILSNLTPIVQAHEPEVCLAWLQEFDSYY